MNTALPVDAVIPALRDALSRRNVAVLEAPPGAGKTTRVPLALLAEPWLEGRRIVMLEPRRLAARNAASWMARTLGERAGETVGYRVRGDSRVSARTRIEIVTEGVLTRLRASDAALEDYGLVIFDEFHERSLHADLGLALVLQSRELLRPELRVLVMSATLDGDAVARCLAPTDPPAPVVRSEGRMFPVETVHRAPRSGERPEATLSRVVREALAETTGDILVFVPGAAEQRRAALALADLRGLSQSGGDRILVHALHGSQSFAEQEAAIAPAPPGARKIVLATSVAETSLTIEGVRTVVDLGLSRLPRYSPRTGLVRLETVRVSRASADQRRGRAGRVAAGRCYRLWDVHEDAMLAPRTRPEILDTDLSSLALELADAGVRDVSELRWMDTPPSGPLAQGRELLGFLGATDAAGRITPHGRQMAALPLSPRLAHMLLVAIGRNQATLASLIAAAMEERDFLGGQRGEVPAEMQLRIELLMRGQGALRQGDADLALHGSAHVAGEAFARVLDGARDLLVRLGVSGARRDRLEVPHDQLSNVGALLALAYPDRVAQRRPGSAPRYLLRNGAGASLQPHDALATSAFLAVAELDGVPPEFRIVRAAPITLDEIRSEFREQVERVEIVEWNEEARAIRGWRREMLGALVLDERRVERPDPAATRAALFDMLRQAGADRWPWTPAARGLRERLAFLHRQDEGWPDVSDDALAGSMERWLADAIEGVRTWAELERADWHGALISLLSWEQRASIDQLAPTHIDVPSGSRVAIDYSDTDAPVLAVKLQEVFGWVDTPRIVRGRVPLTLHLLSPARRPVQVTRDLAGFWRSSYFEVRKELRGRYPRHPWPDDPLAAVATRRVKPRGT